MNRIFKRVWPEVAAIVFFVILSFVYFATPISQGLELTGHDNTAAIGAGREIGEHFDRTGEVSRWTNSLFGGMPTYQIAPRYGSRTVLNQLRSVYELGLPHVVMYVFILLMGFYILMRSMKFKPLLSVVGAIAWAFSSYFFIIIGAGHIWKVLTLAFIPPTLAGIILCYRGKYLWGGSVTALFLSFQILSNHLQMTYYFLVVILAVVVSFFIQALQQKRLAAFFKASGVLAVAAILAVATNASNMYHTYTYSKESMRGKCELAGGGQSKGSGLSKEYITQWSYGIGETWSLLVPNVKGGASVPIGRNEKAMEKADPQYAQVYNQLQQYWGNQPMTSGPVYVGAFIMMLFVLSLFIVKGPLKWGMLIATILSVLLSWGHNFMGLTSFCIDYIPLYNKFRTVASILVAAEFTIPLLAVLALAEILKDREVLKRKAKWVYLSFALTGGISLLFALLPTAFFSSFTTPAESAMLGQAFAQQPQTAQDILRNLSEMRQSVFTADAWRSFFIILVGTALLLAYHRKIIKGQAMVALIGVLCLLDMYSVNRRYLNDDNFEEPRTGLGIPQETPSDQLILQDKSLDYRVLNMSTNTFNENETSYYHKSVGGYNAAKLARYNDIINICLTPEIQKLLPAIGEAKGDMKKINGDSLFPVLNMLNTKYFIVPLQGNGSVPLANPYAYGNAWMVQDVKFVDTANEEIHALNQLDLRKQAVANSSFRQTVGKIPALPDSADRITLASYDCNELHYDVETKNGGLAVFSEIYYPEWTATIDGKPLDLVCVDYVLRGAVIPAGKHKVVMEFRPSSVKTTEAISYVAIVLMVLSFIASLVITLRRQKREDEVKTDKNK